MKKLLWVDDIRNPHRDIKWLIKFAPKFEGEVIWIKNYNDFVKWIENNGFPDKICFDHDLGFKIDALPFGVKHLAHLFYRMIGMQPKNSKSGYDCCKWIVDYCLDNNIILDTRFVYQTDNPVGKENMVTLIDNFKRFQKS